MLQSERGRGICRRINSSVTLTLKGVGQLKANGAIKESRTKLTAGRAKSHNCLSFSKTNIV